MTMYPTTQGGQTVAPSTTQTIGAGTAGAPYGQGWGWGGQNLTITPDYLPYLGNAATAPGYIPGSSSYNQWGLNRPGLFGTIAGQASNMQYGSGGAGDPTNGREPQTPEEWVQGGKLFEWDGNMEGPLGYIGNLFGRSDTPSGIGTPAWSAPQQYWQGLGQQVAAGRVRPTNRGWAALAAHGITPQQLGGGAVAQAQSVGVQPSGAGASGASAGGAGSGSGSTTQTALGSIAASQAADQAARLAYTQYQMRTGDERLAMEKAQQAWTQTFQSEQQRWNQQYQTAGLTGQLNGQDTLAKLNQEFQQRMQQAQLELNRAGLTGTLEGQKTLQAIQQEFMQRATEAGLTGQYNGQETLAAQQQRWQQGYQEQGQQAQNALGLLQLQSSLQGPSDWLRYQSLNANTPGGLQQMLAGFAGQYGFAGSGAQGTPGAATLQSRTQDLLSGGQLGQGGQQQTAQPTSYAGGSPQQNGYALPAPNQINLRNWQAASPSQQQMLLGGYEAAGFWGPDVEKQIAASAPRYTGPATAQVGF